MKISRTALLSCAAATCFATPTEVWAQDGAQTSSEGEAATPSTDDGVIIVTARKRNERLTDVPETIQAFSSETLERAGIADINDIGRLSPNVVLNRRQDNEPNVVIRGIGSFGNTQGIGFYTDDVQNFTDQSPNMGDVERVEILKGPQGTLYGGSNVGGAVKYVMKRPSGILGFEGKIEAGGYNTINGFAAIDAPITKDGSLATRISGYYNNFKGFIYNPIVDERPDKTREIGLRGALAWEPNDDLSFNLSYRHTDLKNGGNIYIRSDSVHDYRLVANLSEAVSNHRKIDGVIFQAEYRPGSVALTSISSYTRRKVDLVWDLDYSPAMAVRATEGDRNKGEVITQELRISSDTSGPLDWIVGGYFANVENRVLTNNVDFYLGPDHPLYALLNPGGTGEFVHLPDFNNADVTERQYAAFATANYRFGNFRLGGGLRLNRSEYTGRRLNEGQTLINDKTSVLPKLSLAYDFGNSLLYANYAQGIEPGRANVTGDFSDLYDAEKTKNYEIGFKGQTPDGALSYDFAAFHIRYKDRQQELQIADPTRGVIELITNIGDSRTWGIEGGLTYRPTQELTLSAGAGWLDAEWLNGEVVGPDEADPALTATYQLRGRDVPNSPKFSSNASADWRTLVTDNLELGMRVDWTRAGNFFWDLRNRAKQQSYDIVNAGITFADADGKWTVNLRVENLLKEEYFNEFAFGVFDEPDAAGLCAGCHLGAPGAPRRVLASLSVDF